MLDLRSKARQRLLVYYFTNPKARHHLRDLAERLGIDPSNLSKELGRLEREGLFRSEVSGRQKYFRLNRDYPLFNEVRSIVAKTIGAAPLITQSLKTIEGIGAAYLYGSFARNQQDAASDIDVLVIGTPRREMLAEAVRKLEKQLGREINYVVLSPKEFESRRSRKDAFLENVWHNKRVLLVGTAEETQATKRKREIAPGSEMGDLMRDVIATKDAPQAIGPYSQAIRANGFVFVSGQVAIDPATQQVISGGVAEQTDRVLKNVATILIAAGSSLEKVVRSTVFLKNMGDFGAMNEVYARYFTSSPPARSTVEAARLPKDVQVEIDVIALA